MLNYLSFCAHQAAPKNEKSVRKELAVELYARVAKTISVLLRTKNSTGWRQVAMFEKNPSKTLQIIKVLLGYFCNRMSRKVLESLLNSLKNRFVQTDDESNFQ